MVRNAQVEETLTLLVPPPMHNRAELLNDACIQAFVHRHRSHCQHGALGPSAGYHSAGKWEGIYGGEEQPRQPCAELSHKGLRVEVGLHCAAAHPHSFSSRTGPCKAD
mmetsp:Transcript_60381/g.155623  ORF Transcript_60381/g.155623 Transcript_60381/m.155623 type:complete len:108 (-) Transcript_60381:39-362(-)